jgi:hypothetical protein
MKTLAFCVLAASTAFAGTSAKTVTFQDASSGIVAFDGKVDLAETVSPQGDSFVSKGSVLVKNISQKEIIAIQVVVNLVMFHNSQPKLYTHDFFFKAHGIAPSNSVEIAMNMHTFGSGGVNPIENEPSLRAELVFVQFEDGTIVGDGAKAEAVLSQRPQVEDFLRSLSTITDESTLLAELAKPQPKRSLVEALAAGLEGYQHDFGTEATKADIQNRLKNAAQRKATGKF